MSAEKPQHLDKFPKATEEDEVSPEESDAALLSPSEPEPGLHGNPVQCMFPD
jgi:hypothetical protein